MCCISVFVKICLTVNPTSKPDVTEAMIASSVLDLSDEDQELISRARRNIKGTISSWDFADILFELLTRSSVYVSPYHPSKSGKALVAEFVSRTDRKIEAKEAKLKLAVSKRDIDELAECTFKPVTLDKPLFKANARYMKPVAPRRDTPVRPGLEVDTHETFAKYLRNYVPSKPVSSRDGVPLTPEVMRRLDAAEEFFEVHRSERSEHRRIMNRLVKEHRAKVQSN